jgi:hypothetical protein
MALHYKRVVQQLDANAKNNVIKTNKNTPQHQQHINKMCWNFQSFVNYYFEDWVKDEEGNIIPLAPFHLELVEKFVTKKYAIINAQWSRNMAKSTIVQFMLIWIIFRKYHGVGNIAIHNVVIASGTVKKAAQLLFTIRAILDHHHLLINDCEKFRKKDATWSQDSLHIKISATVDILFTCISRDSDVRGLRNSQHRVDVLVMDDISDNELVANEERAIKTWEFLRDAAIGAVDITKPHRILFMENSYHKNSLIRMHEVELRDAIKRDPKNADDILLSKVCLIDETTGKSNWPERFTPEIIEKLQLRYPTLYAREYLQKDTASGRYFKPELIRFTDGAIEKYRRILSYYDPAIGQTDFKSLVTVGLTEDMKFVILDLFVRQTSIEDVVDYFFDLHVKYPTTRIYIENVFSQSSTHWPIVKMAMSKRGIHLPLSNDDRKKENKNLRIESLQPYFKEDILWDMRLKNTVDYENATQQMFAYVSGGVRSVHDDFLDSLEGALFMLNQGRIYKNFDSKPLIIGSKKEMYW